MNATQSAEEINPESNAKLSKTMAKQRTQAIYCMNNYQQMILGYI